MRFPEGFAWGAATASYQIEGAAYEDGKGLSVWDMMCRQPDKIWAGNTGDVACDHYHRWEEDIQLMAEIGLKAYRYSISWPRVLPEGTGAVNRKALDFYDRLTDALLAAGIEPWVTLFHWDYPYALFCRGGWLNRDSADWFADHTRIVVDALSDRVRYWIPQNEPQCYIDQGHRVGVHAPGLRLGFAEVLRAAHHSLLAHGKAVQAIRAAARQPATIGTALVTVPRIPASDDPADIAAAKSEMFAVTARECWDVPWIADALLLGRYPEDGLHLFGRDMLPITGGDMETICQPLDFVGLNTYSGRFLGKQGALSSPANPALTTMEWDVMPEALYWGPRFMHERYGLPIAMTENGLSTCDWVGVDGKVHDTGRIDFLTRYLRNLARASADGIPIRGYFLWSLMDNFEWAHGFKRRFGLIHIDYATQRRTLKDSAYWYRDLIASQGATLCDPE